MHARQRLDLVAFVEVAERTDVNLRAGRRHPAQKQVMLSAKPSRAAVAAIADELRPPLVAMATRGVSRVADATARSRSSRARST